MCGVWCVGCTYGGSSPWLKPGVMWVVCGVLGARMVVVAHGLNQGLCGWCVVCGVDVWW